jgi:hypothetical protein
VRIPPKRDDVLAVRNGQVRNCTWACSGAYTIEEFDHAQALGLDCLVYEIDE